MTTSTAATRTGPFQPFSATWISSTTAFVLGGSRCYDLSSLCDAELLRTDDRGQSWGSVHIPALTAGPANNADLRGVRFADSRDGYLYGRYLWSTHDAGAHWTKVVLAGRPSNCATVDALEIGTGVVHAVNFGACSGPLATFTMYDGVIERDAFVRAAIQLPIGAGPEPEVQLVVHGARAWVVDSDRTLGAAARFVAGRWRTWTDPPCAHAFPQPQLWLAAGSDGVLVAVCSYWGVPSPSSAWVSTDGGATFVERSASTCAVNPTGVLGTDVWIGERGDASSLVRTSDGGKTCVPTLAYGSAQPLETGFTTATQGYTILSGGPPSNDRARMFLTTDAGRTWRQVRFGH